MKVLQCQRLLPNANGRDLVVGDLHGHRDLLERALDDIAFDPQCDRVLSVGDLIDRGPDSLATLALIEQPWFRAVLGNHELMLLNYLGYYDSRLHSRKSFACGGGDRINAAIARNPKLVARLADRVAALPLALYVEGDAPFNVTHADVLAIGSRKPGVPAERAVCVHDADAATSSRANFAMAIKSELLGMRFAQHQVRLSGSPLGELPITYVGHSPIQHITVHASFVYIDQGAGAKSKRGEPTLPTVLDHRRFAYWLDGAARARSAAQPSATTV